MGQNWAGGRKAHKREWPMATDSSVSDDGVGEKREKREKRKTNKKREKNPLDRSEESDET